MIDRVFVFINPVKELTVETILVQQFFHKNEVACTVTVHK